VLILKNHFLCFANEFAVTGANEFANTVRRLRYKLALLESEILTKIISIMFNDVEQFVENQYFINFISI
jgi:hypothetical protein